MADVVIESIPKAQSTTIRAVVLASVAGLISLISLVTGHAVDDATTKAITGIVSGVFDLITLGSTVWAYFSRLNTTAVIQGSKGEAKLLAAGATVVPMEKGAAPGETASKICVAFILASLMVSLAGCGNGPLVDVDGCAGAKKGTAQWENCQAQQTMRSTMFMMQAGMTY